MIQTFDQFKFVHLIYLPKIGNKNDKVLIIPLFTLCCDILELDIFGYHIYCDKKLYLLMSNV